MKTTSKQYDIEGFSSGRVFINTLRYRLMPVGHVASGPKLLPQLKVIIRHHVGFWIAEQQFVQPNRYNTVLRIPRSIVFRTKALLRKFK